MRDFVMVGVVLSSAIGPWVVSSAQEPLTVEAALGLGKEIKPAYGKPISWIDPSHYLAIDTRPDNPAKGYVVIDVENGSKRMLFEPSDLEHALAKLPGITAKKALDWSLRTDFVISADGSSLAFEADSDLFAWRIGEPLATRVTNDVAAEEVFFFTKDGKGLAFVKENDLYAIALYGTGGSTPRALTTEGDEHTRCGKLDWLYQEEVYGRGNWKGYFWSDDGSKIACLVLDERDMLPYTIVDDRKRRPDVEVEPYSKPGDPNPRAHLDIIDVASGKRVRTDLSRYADQETLLVRVHWQPNSSRVLLQVQDRLQKWLDLVAVDPASGATHRLFREEAKDFTDPTDAPFFTLDGKWMLWLSERDGYKQLYRLGQDGVVAGRLTNGPFEVDSIVRITYDDIFFTCDVDDVKGEQLYRVHLDERGDSTPTRITQRAGTHVCDVSPDGRFVVDEWSSLTDPGDVSILTVEGKPVRLIAKANREPIRKYGIGNPEFVKFKARDGKTDLEAYWIKPKDFDATKKYPVFQFTYSGPHAPQALDRYLNRDIHWYHYLAQQGYLVFVCDNRSASGRGHQSLLGVYRNLGTQELKDLEDSADWLAAQGFADPQRFALFGWSYGGYMTAFAMTHSKKWKIGIVGAPVTDWSLYDSIYTERYMGFPAENPEGYAASSALRAAKDLSGEVLLIHGTIDDNVHMQNTLQFAEALQRANKPFSMMLYPGNRHTFTDAEQKVHLYSTITRFLKEKL